MVTVTAESRRLLQWWLRQRGDEQVTINWWLRETSFGVNHTKLLELPGGKDKRWPRHESNEKTPLPPPRLGTFPRHLATVMLKEITRETIIYHAVGLYVGIRYFTRTKTTNIELDLKFLIGLTFCDRAALERLLMSSGAERRTNYKPNKPNKLPAACRWV